MILRLLQWREAISALFQGLGRHGDAALRLKKGTGRPRPEPLPPCRYQGPQGR